MTIRKPLRGPSLLTLLVLFYCCPELYVHWLSQDSRPQRRHGPIVSSLETEQGQDGERRVGRGQHL
jgi:hypothetical protein